MRRHLLIQSAVICGFVVLSITDSLADDDQQTQRSPDASSSRQPQITAEASSEGRSITDQITALRAEYEAKLAAQREASAKGVVEYKNLVTSGKLTIPEFNKYASRVMSLAAREPQTVVARDAMIWVICQPDRGDPGGSAYEDEFSHAVNLLVQYHADDPDVARVGLSLDKDVSRRRDAFLEGVYASAKSRETMGLSRMALAQYLVRKAAIVASEKERPRLAPVVRRFKDRDGNVVERKFELPNEFKGYRVHFRWIDPDALRSEAARLFQEVIADYGDILYLTHRDRELQVRLQANPPSKITDPVEKEAMLAIEQRLARIKPLREVAGQRFQAMIDDATDKPTPDANRAGAKDRP
jgi:hypothetical protein